MKIYRIPMVPGPVSVSREVLEAGQENFGSADLEKEYIDLYKATEKSLRKIMQTKNSVVIQTGEGMLALWSALKSCLLPGDKVLVLSTGLFGYGMGGMAEAIGCEVRTVGFGFDETFTDFDLIEKAIREFQPKMITMVQNETPSGTMNPVAEIGALKEKYAVPLLYVDVFFVGERPGVGNNRRSGICGVRCPLTFPYSGKKCLFPLYSLLARNCTVE